MTTALSTETKLFEINYGQRTVVALAPFYEAIDSALTKSALIGRVTNEEENAALTEALLELKVVTKLAEQGRTEAKKPILDFGRGIDAYFTALVADARNEEIRIGTLGGNYQTLLEQQRRAEQALRMQELIDIERRKQEELAKAKTHEEVDAIQERSAQEVQAVPQPIAPVRAHRQVVSQDIDFEVFDIDALYRSHPKLVKMEAKRADIKALLKAGVQLSGVRAIEQTKVGVRLPVQKTIDV